MLESERLLFNIQQVAQQIIDIGKLDLDPQDKAEILRRLDLEQKGFEAAYSIVRKEELSQQRGQQEAGLD